MLKKEQDAMRHGSNRDTHVVLSCPSSTQSYTCSSSSEPNGGTKAPRRSGPLRASQCLPLGETNSSTDAGRVSNSSGPQARTDPDSHSARVQLFRWQRPITAASYRAH